MPSWGIRSKLIAIFVVIKVIPLLLLLGIAWLGYNQLGAKLTQGLSGLTNDMRATVSLVGESMTADSIKALESAGQETMERLTTDTAKTVADFLYDRDSDIKFAASLEADEGLYRNFISNKTRKVHTHKPWKISPEGDKWIPGPEAENKSPPITPSVKDNERSFHYREPEDREVIVNKPLFVEMTFVDLKGQEKIKVTAGDIISKELKDVSKKENTYIKAESYFPQLLKLKPGEIYVSDVIGAYVKADLIGPYTPKSAEKKNIPFKPEESGYSGTENPVGKKYQAIVRWATPVVKDGQIIGFVTLALDHTHIMQLTDHIMPTGERYSAIPDAASGNYAFIWDYKGRSIVHPRHYFITGYDSETGEPAPPWMEEHVYKAWKQSGFSLSDFMDQAPTFQAQSLQKRPAVELTRSKYTGLDCRYLDFAPQCVGWWDLTSRGGSGSFVIFWSGLWKLTTAATIPYYTGQYGATPRGFGFVTIGSNVDDFNRPATQAKERIDRVVAERDIELKATQDEMEGTISSQVKAMTRDLSISTTVMIILVIGVAIWMASILTKRIRSMIADIGLFEKGDLKSRLQVTSQDEMGDLAKSFNQMADKVEEAIKTLEDAKLKAEEVSRLKSDFLAHVSHELRTPLNGILGFAELLREEAENEENKESADIILNSGKHLLEIVNTILDLSKIEAGKLTLSLSSFDPKELLAEVVQSHKATAEAKGLEINANITEHIPHVITDSLRLRQVLHNLLHNAVKFTEKGNVELGIIKHDNYLRFIVKDTGPGIPFDAQAHIFDKFRQVDQFVTRQHGGSGLGLALAKQLIELMGGEIGVNSTPGQGAEFYFTLPFERGK